MIISQDITPCFKANVGEHGVEEAAVMAFAQHTEPAIAELAALKGTGNLPMLDIPFDTSDIAEIEALAQYIREGFSTLVVLGTGGSSLGGQMLCALRQPYFRPAGPRVVFVDNVDPITLTEMVETLEMKRTFFLLISKSGGTPETILQALLARDAISKACGPDVTRHMAAITVPEPSPLRTFAKQSEIPVLVHHPKLGGRFSTFSSVGLLPACVAGLDIRAVRSGAAQMIDATLTRDKTNGIAAIGAGLHRALQQSGKNIQVLMPYADRLRLFGAWHAQVWAESLGKNGQGVTAVRAVGSVDQHSQLQLYLDGPRDKYLTLVMLDNKGVGVVVPPAGGDASLDYLKGKKAGDLIDAQQRATAVTLTGRGVPLRTLKMKSLGETELGALAMLVMLETILTAHLMGVDAYDQPAVEEGKVLAREYLSNG